MQAWVKKPNVNNLSARRLSEALLVSAELSEASESYRRRVGRPWSKVPALPPQSLAHLLVQDPCIVTSVTMPQRDLSHVAF